MSAEAMTIPSGGIDLSNSHHLYVVDMGTNMQRPQRAQRPERRAFVDVGAAVDFIDGRAARLSALLAPLGESAEAAVFGLVEEVFQSTQSRTFLLRFSNSPSLVIKCKPSSASGEFEPFRRIYPPAGTDV